MRSPTIPLSILIVAACLTAPVLHAEPEKADRVRQLKERLEANPDDQDARQRLLVILVVDRDDPEAARVYSSEVDDELWRDCVLLAERDKADLREDDLLKVGYWYRSLASKARGPARLAMYRRSEGYYAHYLKVHTAQDDQRAEADVYHRSVAAMIRTLERRKTAPAPKPAGKPGKESESSRVDLKSDLVVHWTFDDDTEEQVADQSGRGNPGKFQTGQAVESPRGRALGGRAALPDSLKLRHSGSYTVALWVEPGSRDEASGVVLKADPEGRGGHQYALSLREGDGRPVTVVDSGAGGPVRSIVAGEDVEPDTWTHLVVTQKLEAGKALIAFFINGQPAGEGQTAGKALNSPADLVVGLPEGRIDDLRIYHRALSPAEAAEIYRLDAMPDQGEPEGDSRTLIAADDGPNERDRAFEAMAEDNSENSSEFFGIKIKK